MKVHLNQIPPEGLHVEGEEAHDILELEDPIVHVAGPVRYSLDVGVSGSGLFATGSLEIDLELECVRCLEHFNFALKVPAFAMQTELDGRETVDLTPFMREDILLALPSYPHCDWSGEKTCAGPRMRPAGESARPVRIESKAWDELNKLKIKARK
jgi:DUF177 domain-containing protein